MREEDLVGRFGGDEFMIICEGADSAAAQQITDRLQRALAESPTLHPGGGTITASIGVASFNGASRLAMSMDEIFEAADAAMYRSKRSGKDSVTAIELTGF